MVAPQFTPGPWSIEWPARNEPEITSETDWRICDMASSSRTSTREANAHLIAAAPELYEAAQVAMTAIRPLCDQGEDRIWRAAVKAMDALSAAASKARGETP